MKNIVISIGCSFTEGVGCYNKVALKEFQKGNVSDAELLMKSYPNMLAGCIGTLIAKEMGYLYHYNYGRGGKSIKQQLDMFYKDCNKFDFFKENVFIYLGVTYPNRSSTFINGITKVIHESDIRSGEFYKEQKSELLNLDIISNQAVYINSLLNISILQNIPTIVDFMDYSKHNESIYRKVLLNENDYSNIKYVFKDRNMYLDKTDYAYCGHPNQYGYKKWAGWIFDEIEHMSVQIHKESNNVFCKSIDNNTKIELLNNNQFNIIQKHS